MQRQSSEEKTAAMGLFKLKSMLRDKIKECEDVAQSSTAPQTKKWYRFFSIELENLLRRFDDNPPKYLDVP